MEHLKLAVSPVLTFYSIAERVLCVEALDEWSAHLANGFIKEYQLTPLARARVEKIACTIRIRRRAPLPQVPSDLQQFEVAHGHCYTDGSSYYLELSDSIIHVRPRASQLVDVFIGDTADARQQTSLVNLLAYAVQAALRRCGFFDLHAAGVALPGREMGALIIGDSGSGKTTLTVQLARHGWRYLTDDILVLHESERGVAARGLRRMFTLTESALSACGWPQAQNFLGAPIPSDPNKRRLEPDVVFPKSFAESCRPEALLFPVITGKEQTQSKKLSSGAAMMRLLACSPWSRYDTAGAREHLRVLERLVKQSTAYELLAGRDLLDEPGRAAALFCSAMNGEIYG